MDRPRSTAGEAKLELQRAVAVDAAYADALYNLGQHVHYRLGDLAKAGECWVRYLTFDQTSEWCRKAREGLTVCRAAMGKAAAGSDRR